MSHDAGSTEFNIFSGNPPTWNEISNREDMSEILDKRGAAGLKKRVSNKDLSISDDLGFFDDTLLVTLGGRYQVIENYG